MIMEIIQRSIKKIATILVSSIVVFVMLFAFAPVQSTYAAGTEGEVPAFTAAQAALGTAIVSCLEAGFVAIPCIAAAMAKNLKAIERGVVAQNIQVALITIVLDLFTFLLDTLAYNLAVWIASGGQGQESLISGEDVLQGFAGFGLDLANEGMKALNLATEGIDLEFDVCAPEGAALKLGLQLGIQSSYKPPKPKCDWRTAQQNWEGLIQRAQETIKNPSTFVLKEFSKSLKPGKTNLSAAIKISSKVHKDVYEKKGNLLAELLADDGIKDVVDPVSLRVKTPASTVKKDFENKVAAAEDTKGLVNVEAIIQNPDLALQLLGGFVSTFATTLIGELLNKVYTGIIDQPTIDQNPFIAELANVSGREAAKERFSGLLTSTPKAISNYSVLSEFVACPAGIGTRQLNNCVMDVNFSSAVSRSSASAPITIQDAMDENLIHGNYRLYGPESVKNSDAFCFNEAYCYGNLVKMRKARIISIGWEMAAQIAEDRGEAVTLQEVVDGFDSCGEGETWDEQLNPWCHLIDPNWVLKVPETQCKAFVNGELILNPGFGGRGSVCADAPACIGQDEDGLCEGGFGYCVREKNVWRVRGDSCPAEFASCLSFTNTDSAEKKNLLLKTADFSVCDSNNVGCQWYRTNKYLYNQATPSDASDDTFEFLPPGDIYLTEGRDADVKTTTSTSPPLYLYDYGSYAVYAYQDRVYYNNKITSCSEAEAGCTELYPTAAGLSLNLLRNPSFEIDDDGDSEADNWVHFGAFTPGLVVSTTAYRGNNVYQAHSPTEALIQSSIVIEQGEFYTMSAYVKASSALAPQGRMSVQLSGSDGSAVNITNFSATCSKLSSDVYAMDIYDTANEDEWTRVECAFTTPNNLGDSTLDIIANVAFSNVLNLDIDGVQLEPGSVSTRWHEGYSSNAPATEYLKVAPSWMGCTGGATDPVACDSYAQACSATQVGCELYSPTGRGSDVPAVISSLDQCPTACVGYTTYKQEATLYDDEDFPQYFIADSASACSAVNVGCDEFTNLDTEGVESYKYLRACVTPEMDTGSTYFTWEGSDQDGYQLISWQLLESDLPDSGALIHPISLEIDSAVGLAPCTTWAVNTTTLELECQDSYANIQANVECDEHQDIFDNPDCREFYDSTGLIHYRSFEATVTASAQCTPYRKTTSSQSDCQSSGGGWTTNGECRYFGLASESNVCPGSAVGCRSYTGGSGNASSTVLSQDFENGTFSDFITSSSTTLNISNESVATDGHSLRSQSSSAVRFNTWRIDFNPSNPSDTCLVEDGCPVIDAVGNTCIVEEDATSCGPLFDELVDGKTYLLNFWAKGTGTLQAAFYNDVDTEYYDFVNPNSAVATSTSSLAKIVLENEWNLYELGPIDTTTVGYGNFDSRAALFFASTGSGPVYIDNIELIQAGDNITLIKDSWVTPNTCDLTPAGTASPQYYLGCEAYTDPANEAYSFYQFTNLCQEEVVGCEAFYDTQNSDSVYGEVFNATCYNNVDADSDGVFAYQALNATEDTVTTLTSCLAGGEEVCQIGVGLNRCNYNIDGAIPSALDAHTVLGPEARIVSNDQLVYYVNDGSATCGAGSAGCTEIGLPEYTQDRSQVISFEASYVIDDPDSYSGTLCGADALFCEEWATSQDGNFFFKDPEDKTCEYKTSVKIDNNEYSGWFRTGTSEFCYGTGTCTEGTTVCSEDADCAAVAEGECLITAGTYVIGGITSGIWNNGDTVYDGWAGECKQQYDLCSQFIDPVDTSGGANPDGSSYYVLDNDTIDESSLQDAQRCNGEVSLESGCVLFQDIVDASFYYSSSPSYLVSEHADLIYSDEPGSLVPPVDCNADGGGDRTLTDGSAVNVCEQRCQYIVESAAQLDIPGGVYVPEVPNVFTPPRPKYYFANSCLTNSDCPNVQDSLGNDVSGLCKDLDTDFNSYGASFKTKYTFTNDTNRILKVNRDRQCAEWLACSSSQASWDAESSSYKNICNQLDLCTDYGVGGGSSFCTEWTSQEPLVLDEGQYTSRDVSWYGLDYSGYSIPNKIPSEFYEQQNVNPSQVCTCANGNPSNCSAAGEIPTQIVNPSTEFQTVEYIACSPSTLAADCGSATDYTCENADEDYRLVFRAGSCESTVNGESCQVGFCSRTGRACSEADTGICEDDESCIYGYCEESTTTSCSDSNPCGGGDECRGGVCVDTTTGTGNTQESCFSTSDCSAGICAQGALAKIGLCYNNNCLTDINGNTFAKEEVATQECRGYPEIMSPFPIDAAEPDGWLNDPWDVTGAFIGTESVTKTHAVASNMVPGYGGVDVCSPVCDGAIDYSDGTCSGNIVVSDDCSCNYDKVSYGPGGAIAKYYPLNTGFSNVPDGVCNGGDEPGRVCQNDSDCGADITATCVRLTKKDSVIGWPGYCIERDTSIHLYGTPDEDACLTWLPIDQLVGTPDIYAQYTQAGYALENTYYCTEVGYYRDYYTAGAIFNSDGSVDKVIPMCAESRTAMSPEDGIWEAVSDPASCTDAEYQACWYNAWCPDGYIGLIGKCGSHANLCTGGSSFANGNIGSPDGDQDCPYMCIPMYSRNALTGAKCDPTSGYTNTTHVYPFLQSTDIQAGSANSISDLVQVTLDDVQGFYQNPTFGTSYFGTPVILVDDLVDDIDSVELPNQQKYMVSGSPQDEINDFKDCVVRGIPVNVVQAEEAGWIGIDVGTDGVGGGDWDNFYQSSDMGNPVVKRQGYNGLRSYNIYYDHFDPDPSGLGGSIIPYLGCYEIAQVTSDDIEETNKAWTNRIWAQNNGVDRFFTGPPTPEFYDGSDEYEIDILTTPVPAGRALFEEYWDIGDTNAIQKSSATNTNRQLRTDSFPLPVESCIDSSGSGNNLYLQTVSPVGMANGSLCNTGNYGTHSYPFLATWHNGDDFTVGPSPSKLAVSYENIYWDSQLPEDYLRALITSTSDPNWVNPRDTTNPATTYDPNNNYSMFGSSDNDTKKRVSVTGFLGQWFAKTLRVYRYHWIHTRGAGDQKSNWRDQRGRYVVVGGTEYDVSSVGDAFGNDVDEGSRGPDKVPQIASVGDCYGTLCQEKTPGKFTINDRDTGTVLGSEAKHASIKFYAWADSNQMPIKNIRVDWGDGNHIGANEAWPLTNQIGSTADTNFYKNHRGLKPSETTEAWCNDGGEFGLTPTTCDTSYLNFDHDYTCSEDYAADLPTCELAGDGTLRLRNSPCTGGVLGAGDSGDRCVFQPRVHVKDNWGWCTGYCDVNDDDSTDQCYGVSECNSQACPSLDSSGGGTGFACGDNDAINYDKIANSWINYDGYIIITP